MEENILNLPRWEDIPDIGIYSEQAQNLINSYLNPSEKYIERLDLSNSYITSNMINNYVKKGLLPAPKNKKYYREHIAHLLIISLLKQIYRAHDIYEMFNIAYTLSEKGKAYNVFKEVFTYSLNNVFSKKEIDGNLKICLENKERYLLKNIADSIAKKIYAESLIKEYKGKLKK